MSDTTKPSAKALDKLSDDELAAEAAALAKLRTEVRERQNAVQAEQETRTMLAGLSGAAREVVRARLFGNIAPTGDAAAEKGSKA